MRVLMKNSLLIILVMLTVPGYGIDLTQFREVDHFKSGKTDIKVYFNDPVKYLAMLSPDFDSKPSIEKFQLLNEFLHNNVLYIFIATNKKEKFNKIYVLRGNPKKQRTKFYFQIDVLNEVNSDL